MWSRQWASYSTSVVVIHKAHTCELESFWLTGVLPDGWLLPPLSKLNLMYIKSFSNFRTLVREFHTRNVNVFSCH